MAELLPCAHLSSLLFSPSPCGPHMPAVCRKLPPCSQEQMGCAGNCSFLVTWKTMLHLIKRTNLLLCEITYGWMVTCKNNCSTILPCLPESWAGIKPVQVTLETINMGLLSSILCTELWEPCRSSLGSLFGMLLGFQDPEMLLWFLFFFFNALVCVSKPTILEIKCFCDMCSHLVPMLFPFYHSQG